jgi:Endoplasmic Reticulum Oxidoreductin 1 (ERO1)
MKVLSSERTNKQSTTSPTLSFITICILCCLNHHQALAFVPYDHKISSNTISKINIPPTQHVSSLKNIASIGTSLYSVQLQKSRNVNRINNKKNYHVLYLSSSPAAERQHYSRSNNIDLLSGMTIIDTNVDILYDKLSKFRDTSLYFRLYSVDILGSCEYMSQELSECYAERCEIYPEDDDMVREITHTHTHTHTHNMTNKQRTSTFEK